MCKNTSPRIQFCSYALFVILFILQRIKQSSEFESVTTLRKDVLIPFNNVRKNFRDDYGLSLERQRYDGWYNNMAHPEWGAVESRLIRKTPQAYGDGVYMMAGSDRPNPRKLSQAFMKGVDGLGSLRNRTALLAFFGQVVSAEILMASESGCPLEIHHIEIEKCDEMYDKDCQANKNLSMPFYRANYDRITGQSPNTPREQVNRMTSWIDGSFVYSSNEAWISTMRSYSGNGDLIIMEDSGSAIRNGPKVPPHKGMPPYNQKRVPLFNHPSPHVMKHQNPERMFVLGDPRTNQNPAFLALGILFFRWHNVLASRIKKRYPLWRDEDVFQAARRWNIASLQNIIAYEYIPAFLGARLSPYQGYKSSMHPGISHVFQSAAFRFGHTMIPPGIYLRDGKCNFQKNGSESIALRLCSSWWDAQGVVSELMGKDQEVTENILRGLSSQIAEREDANLCSDVRNKLFGPMEFSRRDLASLNIMRGRDNGLPDYNTVRKCYGLPMINSWSEINVEMYKENPEPFHTLRDLYGEHGLTNIDLFIGGMLETRTGPGELFTSIVKEQFETLRDSDRFWFENTENQIFTPSEIEEIRHITLWDIIVNATLIKPDEIQKHVFFWMDSDPCPQPRQLNSSNMPECNLMQQQDAFQGSETAYIYALVLILFFPFVCWITSYGMTRLRQKQSEDARKNIQQKDCISLMNCISIPNENNVSKNELHMETKVKRLVKSGSTDNATQYFAEGIWAQEWLNASNSRLVFIVLEETQKAIQVFGKKGEILRSIPISNTTKLTVKVNKDIEHSSAIGLIEVPENFDLVLEFSSEYSRENLLRWLDTFITSMNTEESNNVEKGDILEPDKNESSLVTISSDDTINNKKTCSSKHKIKLISFPTKNEILKDAQTKERRQEKLDHFFREAYSLSFGAKFDKSFQDMESYASDLMKVMQTSLTKHEFASALDMKTSDLFVKKMFRVVDKDRDGRISFQEFLDIVIQFSTSNNDSEEKLRIVFDMCMDEDQPSDPRLEATVNKTNVIEMLNAVIDLGKVNEVNNKEVSLMIESMFKEAGLKNKKQLTFKEFKLLMSHQYGDESDGEKSTKNKSFNIGLEFKGAKRNFVSDNIGHPQRFQNYKFEPAYEVKEPFENIKILNDLWWHWSLLTTFLEENRQHIFYLLVFFVVTALLFINKFVQYAFMSEHTDLRHIMGIGIAVTRGSAAALSFCYSILLLSMSRNMLTKLKETSIYQYIPLDSHVQFHKICACTALFFTLVHVAGHLVNFYHIATQPLERLMCLSPEVSFPSDFKPDFPYFLFKTLAGVTGVLLYTTCCIIFIFSLSSVRQKAYNWFWMAHQFYILLFILTLLHGLQRLTAAPSFWLFFIGPATVFVIDKVVSLRRGYMELDVLETELLPSDVIKITFYRPPNFTFRSGQWVRVACEAIGNSEWHSLSITSAPHENSLSLHIKAKGPWTWRLRNHFDSNFVSVKHGVTQLVGTMKDPSGQSNEYWNIKRKKDDSKKRKHSDNSFATKSRTDCYLSDKNNNEKENTEMKDISSLEEMIMYNEKSMKQKILFDKLNNDVKIRDAKSHAKIKLLGPFGGGNQDWYKFEIAVMIGAGIGITPYASILNDLVYGTSTNKFSGVACRKVYFLWICPSHRNYEWFIEVLREVEEKDITNVLDIHIFITQFFHNYDLRTTMLYICENHFQRLSKKSLFTGLKAANHFGRPDLVSFLRYVQKRHSYVSKIGVFSCGPRSVTRASEAACESVNQSRNLPYASHHFEQYS